ncbi:MAG TPA: acyl-CoA dehydrogenase [Accumulibacter sp.]|uniref:Acyl-coenzyme A dehydrogenase n=1 Tax=Candidatus Accumulibacter cognatus TaxID=2954383 RepID=A0A080MAR5_9PROT|nr:MULTISPECIES: acyl-CoA dehydrogenase [Candidatus Accumulibacter]MCC2869514.1 acyl-CoA dehydrogenase [Candidatus Accumulibacter phosphatis]KFB78328.1 MAG: Acyl-coenzyme A dehydrogenase [Candidatus Accumulibacter cognatus]MBN8516736.1 acyl-CoA dehydrogenase [Accumulibacter sp.]MBO3710054.1 acyl-CoA dehydrogenase [Accumulibacter sp.]MCM8579227.1 acyl-CoA dehydrogenase [Accumulibacter sp.]
MITTVVSIIIGITLVSLVVLFGFRPLRRALISRPIFNTYKRILPQMSDTERVALEAGTVWWDGELFRGNPDWEKLLAYPVPTLRPEEQSFMDNEVEQVCALVDDWQVTNELYDLPPQAWQYIKDKGFLGMIIPKKYGGLEFSAYAHSQIVTKLSTRCSALSVSVMVPNSLGPAELLLHYGTEAQKNHYLPRLAKGIEIPAFALTSPWAGSDAGSIPDVGIVCKGMWQGREVLGMRVTWDKRYITLGPVCTILGLAFHLYDPDGLLGSRKHLGITCALVPRDTPGAEIGRRHFPLNAMFMNGPTRGKDVFMPLDYVIGGPAMVGQGWRMLMECLAAGRSISLPSSNAGMAQLTARTVGAYARVRSQFKMAIGRFEGVEEPLTRIGAYTYMMNAVRIMTAGAIDLGEKPSVVSAIAKYHVTERARQVVNDGMDIVGGKGICLGPSNFIGRAYQQLPIGITVEGANILTRSMILFGQGAIRCHPYVLKEMKSAFNPDPQQGLRDFDKAFFGHLVFTIGHAFGALRKGLTGSHFVSVPANVAPETRRYYQQLTRFASAFAFLSDISMLVLGGELKRREKLSARLGDILSMLYLCSATLKRYESEGRQQADAPLMHWAMWDAMYKAQMAFDGVIANFPVRWIARMLYRLVFPLGHPYDVPSDRIGHQVAKLLIEPSAARDRLTAESYLPKVESEAVGALELALAATIAAEPIEAKIRAAEKSGVLTDNPDANVRDLAHASFAAGIVTAAEYAVLKRRNELRDIVIRVDDFPHDLGHVRQQPLLHKAA